jgi:hypothetical protein
MNHLKVKIVGVLFAVLALSVAVTVPGVAVAEEAAPEAQPTVEALIPEPCNSGHVCAYNSFNWDGGYGESLCTGGYHELNNDKGSVKNRCANKAAWLYSWAGVARGCVNPGGDQSIIQGFRTLYIGAEGSRC